MRAGVIASAVLGIGTVVVFALAVAAASLFPDGGTVISGWNGGMRTLGGPVLVPAPAPGVVVWQGSGGVQVPVPDVSPSN